MGSIKVLDELTFKNGMVGLTEVFGKKLGKEAMTLLFDAYFNELKTMPKEKFLAGVEKAIAQLPHQKSSFPTTKQLKEFGYGATDEQRAAQYRELDKSRTLDVSKADKEHAAVQWENVQLLGKCISLGIPQAEIVKKAATGSLLDLIRQHAPAAAITKKEVQERTEHARQSALQTINQWRAEGAI
jgi:hypothetical protein